MVFVWLDQSELEQSRLHALQREPVARMGVNPVDLRPALFPPDDVAEAGVPPALLQLNVVACGANTRGQLTSILLNSYGAPPLVGSDLS
jgi:hypothetical protein